MEQRAIDSIIIKLIENRISEEESVFLLEWMEESENKTYFDEFVETSYLIHSKNSFDYSDSLKKAQKRIRQKKEFRQFEFLKYAAMVILFLGVGYYFVEKTNTNPEDLQPKNQGVVLEMSNGAHLTILDSAQQVFRNKKGTLLAVQQGNRLNYKNKTTAKDLGYNKLIIPYGKTFSVILSDGTLVHLNSGTSLRFPEKFIQGQNRMVFVDGEAYFKVAKDKKHPFIVNSKEVNIRVTGTEFNVSNYDEDQHINTVLVEGSIQMYSDKEAYNEKKAVKIKPNELAAWNKTSRQLAVSTVDVANYTAWKEGVLIFKHMKFKDIIKKMERHFNVKIKNKNQKLNEEVFTARFENSTVEHVLKSFKSLYGINYSIINNEITIK